MSFQGHPKPYDEPQPQIAPITLLIPSLEIIFSGDLQKFEVFFHQDRKGYCSHVCFNPEEEASVLDYKKKLVRTLCTELEDADSTSGGLIELLGQQATPGHRVRVRVRAGAAGYSWP